MIFFKKIKWKNFLSTGNSFTEIDFVSSKSTLIIGENGAGKSTILDAIAFALYGTAHRKIRKPQLLNSVNQKNLLVEIEFSNGHSDFLVRRGMKPGIFEIYQNGSLVNQTAASKDYQVFLEKDILKMNFKSFSQIVVLGSATFVPFMQLTPSSRREVIEDLLDMQIFTVMNIILKDRNLQLKDKYRTNESQTELNIEKLELQRKHREKLEANNKELIEKRRLQIEEYRTNISKLEEEFQGLSEEIKTLMETLDPIKNSEIKKSEYNQLLDKLSKKLTRLNKEDKFYEENDDCPTCHQTIDPVFKTEKRSLIATSWNEVNEVIPKLNDKISKLEFQVTQYKEVFDTIKRKQSESDVKQTSISNYQLFINQLNAEIKDLSDKNEDIKELTDDILILKENLKKLEVEKRDILDTQKLYKIALEMLKDTGIKSLIIKQYVPVINKLVNYYLQQFDFFVQFELDETFSEKIKSRFRDEFSYDSFSEGEKKRIDLALMLTWRSIAKLRNSVSTNLLIMDEVFDGSMDTDGVENLINMIRTVCKDDNIFVISHNRSAMLDKFDTVLTFKKQGNFSRIVTT